MLSWRSVLKEAKKQIKAGDGPENTKRIAREIIDNSEIKEARERKKNSKKTLRDSKRQLRNEAKKTRRESGISKIEWCYSDGELVRIKFKSHPTKPHRFQRWFNNLGINPGDVGVVVESDEITHDEKGRWIMVLGPQGLQKWNAAWVESMDE